MEGVTYLTFDGRRITERDANANFNFWAKQLNIPAKFNGAYASIFEHVNKVFGANTFAARKGGANRSMTIPLYNIFGYEPRSKKFSKNVDCGLKCDRILKGDGAHMTEARAMGLDVYIFAYLGMHLPYHRQDDYPPVCPFGVFLKPSEYAYTHGTPNDRTFVKAQNQGSVEQIEKYFLTPSGLKKVITSRIINDVQFQSDFWKYFGNPADWEDISYRERHWQNKGEYCFFNTVKPEDVAAILWPVWEETATENGFIPNELYELIPLFKEEYDIDVIIYRPYRDIITKENWESKNLRDWEIALVEASFLAQKYYDETGFFPDSILSAKQYFKL